MTVNNTYPIKEHPRAGVVCAQKGVPSGPGMRETQGSRVTSCGRYAMGTGVELPSCIWYYFCRKMNKTHEVKKRLCPHKE